MLIDRADIEPQKHLRLLIMHRQQTLRFQPQLPALLAAQLHQVPILYGFEAHDRAQLAVQRQALVARQPVHLHQRILRQQSRLQNHEHLQKLEHPSMRDKAIRAADRSAFAARHQQIAVRRRAWCRVLARLPLADLLTRQIVPVRVKRPAFRRLRAAQRPAGRRGVLHQALVAAAPSSCPRARARPPPPSAWRRA